MGEKVAAACTVGRTDCADANTQNAATDTWKAAFPINALMISS